MKDVFREAMESMPDMKIKQIAFGRTSMLVLAGKLLLVDDLSDVLL